MTAPTDDEWLAGREDVVRALAQRGLVIVRWKRGLKVRKMTPDKPRARRHPMDAIFFGECNTPTPRESHA